MFKRLITRPKIVMPESIQSRTQLFSSNQTQLHELHALDKIQELDDGTASGAVSITNAAQLRDEKTAQ